MLITRRTLSLWGLTILSVGLFNACENFEPPRACTISEDAEIGTCPAGCFPVRGELIGATEACELEPPALGCADRLTTIGAPKHGEDDSAPWDAISMKDGHYYMLPQDFKYWRRTSKNQWFCEPEDRSGCPPPDPEVAAACGVTLDDEQDD